METQKQTIKQKITQANQPALDAITAQFVSSLEGGKPIYQLVPEEARRVLESVQGQTPEDPRVDIQDIKVHSTVGEVGVKITRPAAQNEKLPGVIYVHGGGWILGSANTHQRLVSNLAIESEAALVFVDYSRSPEVKFPVALEQCFAVAKFVSENGATLGIDTSRLAIAGDSVGGTMAAVLARWAKERGGPKFRYQILLYPVTDSALDTESYRQFAQGPWLTKPAMEWFWNAYEPNVEKRRNADLSPLRASNEQLRNLPPALVIVDENDVLRDEGEAYVRRLMAAGVEVTGVRVLGTIHDFMMLNPLADTPPAREAVEIAIAKLKSAFMIH